MTVAELIAELQKMPQDAEVGWCDTAPHPGGGRRDVTDVYLDQHEQLVWLA